MRSLSAIHQNPISNIHIIQPWISLMYQRPNQFWIIWSVISLDRLKNSFFILFGAFMIKAEMCELLLSLLKVFWSIKVGHKQHLCEIMKPWCGRDLVTSKLSTLRILIKYKLLSERQIYINYSHKILMKQLLCKPDFWELQNFASLHAWLCISEQSRKIFCRKLLTLPRNSFQYFCLHMTLKKSVFTK